MRLPKEEELKTPRQFDLYAWDCRQWFVNNPKRWEAIHYKYRVTKIIETVQRFVPKGGMILDVACAQGNISLLLAEAGYHVIGVDIDETALDYARFKYEFGDCEFIKVDVNNMNFTNKFDAIIQGEFLEHVSKPKDVLLSSLNLLNEDGIVIVTTPNGSAPHNRNFNSYKKLKFKLEQGNTEIKKQGNLAGTREEQHVFSFRYNELTELLEECGYEVLISGSLNSYFVNTLNTHRLFPLGAIQRFNDIASRSPLLKKYLTLSLYAVAKKAIT